MKLSQYREQSIPKVDLSHDEWPTLINYPGKDDLSVVVASKGSMVITRHLLWQPDESIHLHVGDGRWYLLDNGVPVNSQYWEYESWPDGTQIQWIEDPTIS